MMDDADEALLIKKKKKRLTTKKERILKTTTRLFLFTLTIAVITRWHALSYPSIPFR